MSKRPPLSKSELEIARIVWDLGKASVRDVAETLPKEREIDFYTVQTYLRRLEAKGYLKKHREGRRNIYKSNVRPRQVVGELINDFVDRLFDGEALPLFQHLIKEKGLSPEEIKELQKTLNTLKEKKK